LPHAADKGGLRRERESRLLELGALVYELHRRGRRAPELLQRKAGELSEIDERVRGPDEPGPAECPACGADAERGQLVCTECGARLALGEEGPRARVSPGALIALAAIVVIGALASGFAISEITSGDEADGGGGRAPVASEAPAPPAAAEGEPQEPAQAEEPAAEDPSAPEPRRSLLLDWPDGLAAHTVVLVTTSDRPAALRLARDAARSGIEAGLLRGDDYNLGTGLWVVFAGRFDTPEGASRQATDLAERFPGAYPQLVEPAG
jgi:hypothetical protein